MREDRRFERAVVILGGQWHARCRTSSTYLRLTGSVDAEKADEISRCLEEDAELTDEGETRRGQEAIRHWWEGPATKFQYTVTFGAVAHSAAVAIPYSPAWQATSPVVPPILPTASRSVTV